MERTGEVFWVLDHLEDLDADFARYYRCDWQTLSGPRFFSRAQRVTAYGGVLALRVEEARRKLEPEEPEGDVFPALPAGAVTVPESAMADLIE